MTTLADILAAPPADIATLRGLWLAFPAELMPALADAQADQTTHRAEPLPLTDGRAALCADLLTEINTGGLFALQFSRLDAALFSSVEVLDSATFEQLRPPQDGDLGS